MLAVTILTSAAQIALKMFTAPAPIAHPAGIARIAQARTRDAAYAHCRAVGAEFARAERAVKSATPENAQSAQAHRAAVLAQYVCARDACTASTPQWTPFRAFDAE